MDRLQSERYVVLLVEMKKGMAGLALDSMNGKCFSWLAVLVAAICSLGAVGCSERAAYDLSGHVKYADGSPVTGGVRMIRLEPTEDTTATIRKAASGSIADDGSFEMFTRRPGDGVVPGKYKVTFTVMDKPMGGKSLIPEKYTLLETSPFELVVDDDKSDLVYELEKL